MRFVPFAALALLVGCYTSTDPFTATLADTATLGAPFQLRVGERAVVSEAGFSVRFLDVVADSRCPSHALILCVWEGDGAIAVEITPEAGDARTDTLHTTLDPKVLDLGLWELELQRLDPYPETTVRIALEDYVATFVVRLSS